MVDDDGRLRRKFNLKKSNAARDDIGFELTYVEFCRLVKRACLVSSDLGYSGRNYVLARHLDRGPYAIGNCRFITQPENMAERTWLETSSDTMRESIRASKGTLIQETVQVCDGCKKEFEAVRIRSFCSLTCKHRQVKPPTKELAKSIQKLIKQLHADGLSSYVIAKKAGVSRNTVMKYW